MGITHYIGESTSVNAEYVLLATNGDFLMAIDIAMAS
jgi:hypothetical protein